MQGPRKSSAPGADRDGVMGGSYASGRDRKLSLRYRLERRASEILLEIERHSDGEGVRRLLDLGTADGRMIDIFEKTLPGVQVVGVELSDELAGLARARGHAIVRADVCRVPLCEGAFDAVVACAVIEHLRQPLRMVEEARRMLRRGGLVLVTTPSPFWEHVATAVGHLAGDQHHFSLDIPALVQMLRGTGFRILTTRKFMLSPVGMPAERSVEGLLGRAGLDFLMANQIVVGRRL